jgi:hypothetical protein
MWRAPVPNGARLVDVPKDADELARLVREQSGHIVIGWELETDIERVS